MSHYMMMFQYTPDAQAQLVNNPEDRSEAIGTLIEQAGGRMDSYYYSFGEYDGLFLYEAPDDQTAQAIAYAIAASGTISSERTLNLQTVDEKMQVLRKAQELSQAFRPPSG